MCNSVNLVSGGQIVSWSAAVCLANTIMIFICQNFSYYCQILLSKSLFGGNIYSTIKYKCSGNNFNLTFIKDNQRRRTHLLGSRQKKKLFYFAEVSGFYFFVHYCWLCSLSGSRSNTLLAWRRKCDYLNWFTLCWLYCISSNNKITCPAPTHCLTLLWHNNLHMNFQQQNKKTFFIASSDILMTITTIFSKLCKAK